MPALVLVMLMMSAAPALADTYDFGFDEVWGVTSGYSEFTDGSDDDIYHYGYTETGYTVVEIGIRISAYKGGYLDGHTKQRVVGGSFVTSGPQSEHWFNTYERTGDWIGYGYHWAEIGTTAACNTSIDWEVGFKFLRTAANLAASRVDHMLAFDTKAAGINGWELVAFEDFEGIRKLLGIGLGGSLAHYLYLNDVEVLGLAYQDREPAVFIAPNRTEAAVVMFHTLDNSDVLFRLQLDERDGSWRVVDRAVSQHSVR